MARALRHFPPGCGDGERGRRPCQRRDKATVLEDLAYQFRTQIGLTGHNRASLYDQVCCDCCATRNHQIHTERHVGRVGIRDRELVDDGLAVRSRVLRGLRIFGLLGRDDVFDGDCHIKKCCR